LALFWRSIPADEGVLRYRALQAWLGHKNIQHAVRYTEPAPDRFKDFEHPPSLSGSKMVPSMHRGAVTLCHGCPDLVCRQHRLARGDEGAANPTLNRAVIEGRQRDKGRVP
jgi:hypothetical protein